MVGTYLGPPENGKGLDADLAARGLVLDTIVPARSSPELRAPLAESLRAGVDELIELAAHGGKWALVEDVRRGIGPDAAGLTRAGAAIARAERLARVDAGDAPIEELLALQADPDAAGELRTRADKLWPPVKRAALDPARADVRAAFRDLLAQPEHVKELWDRAIGGLRRTDESWDAGWRVIREVAPAEGKKLLLKSVGSEKNEAELPKLPLPARARLRAAFEDVGHLPPGPLLVPVGPGELNALLAGPPNWSGYTAFVLMAKDELDWLAHITPADRAAMRKGARAFLFAAPPEVLAVYVHHARESLATDPHFLKVLFPAYAASTAKLMDTLLGAGVLGARDWATVNATVQLTQGDWEKAYDYSGKVASGAPYAKRLLVQEPDPEGWVDQAELRLIDEADLPGNDRALARLDRPVAG